MAFESTALVMLGLQCDQFGPSASVRDAVEDPATVDVVHDAVLATAGSMRDLEAMVIHVPITFSPGHPEINQQVGILSVIKQRSLLEAGSPGAEPVDSLESLEPDLITLSGRTGFNGFRNTGLDVVLGDRRIQRILLAGAPTVACVDSTARTAYELGYEVVVLSDCILTRSAVEHGLYCNSIFPHFAQPIPSTTLFEQIQ